MSVLTPPLAGAVTAIGAVVRTGCALAREGGGASFSQWLDQRRSESPPEPPKANPREDGGEAAEEPHDASAIGERHRRMRAAAAKAQMRPAEPDARQPVDAGEAVKDRPDAETVTGADEAGDGPGMDPVFGDALSLPDALHRPVVAPAQPPGDKDEPVVVAGAAPLPVHGPDVGVPETAAVVSPSPGGETDVLTSQAGAVGAAPSARRGRDALSALTQGRTALARDDASAAHAPAIDATATTRALAQSLGEAGAGASGPGVIGLNGVEVAAAARAGGAAAVTQPVTTGVAGSAALADAHVAAGLVHGLAQALHAASADAPARVAIAEPLHSPAFAPALGARLALLARDGVQQAELQLNPAEMGPISVQIALDGSRVTVDFAADVAATRSRLESSLPELAAALRESGLTLAGGGVYEQRRGRGEREPGHPAVARSARVDAAWGAHEDDGPRRAAALQRPRGVLDEYA
jgi:hypothetical protein